MGREQGDITGFFSQFDLMVALFQNELWKVSSIIENANDIFYSGHDVSFSSNGDVGVSDVDTLSDSIGLTTMAIGHTKTWVRLLL